GGGGVVAAVVLVLSGWLLARRTGMPSSSQTATLAAPGRTDSEATAPASATAGAGAPGATAGDATGYQDSSDRSRIGGRSRQIRRRRHRRNDGEANSELAATADCRSCRCHAGRQSAAGDNDSATGRHRDTKFAAE